MTQAHISRLRVTSPLHYHMCNPAQEKEVDSYCAFAQVYVKKKIGGQLLSTKNVRTRLDSF
jgi:hypothetical protein